MECYNNQNYAPVNNLPPHSGKSGFWGCLSFLGFGVFLFLSVCVIVMGKSCSSCVSELAKMDDSSSVSATFLCGDKESEDQIAVIDIHGIIAFEKKAFSSVLVSPERVCALIRKAENDPSVKAILIRMDTPGGEVTASDVIRNELQKAQKPVVVQMNSLATSGGYFIATGADWIVAHRMTMTGSIGVIIETLNYSSLFNLIGLKTKVYTSGKMKAMLHGGLDTSKDAERIVQVLVMETYEDFVKAVSKSRKIPVEKLMNSELCDGRILSGVQAFNAGLVDQLGYFEDAVAAAEKRAKIPAGSAKVVLFKPDSSLSDIFPSSLVPENKSVTVSLDGAEKGFRMTPGKAYYLPGFH